MDPVEIIRQAIEKNKAPLTVAQWGVDFNNDAGEWITRGKNCACPLGQVLLVHQPIPESTYSEESHVVADFLDVSLSWVEGFTAGWDWEFGSAFCNEAYLATEELKGMQAGRALYQELKGRITVFPEQ